MIASDVLQALEKIRSLNLDQVRKIAAQAETDVREYLGEEPELSDYLRKVRVTNHLQPLDYMFFLFFIALLLLSVLHIITLGGSLVSATHSTSNDPVGIVIGRQLEGFITQIALVLMSETGSLGFSIRHSQRKREQKGRGWAKVWGYRDLFASVICAVIAIVANVYALTHAVNINQDVFFLVVGWGLGIAIPLLVIYLGEHFADILLRIDSVRQKSIHQYHVDVEAWKRWNMGPETFDSGDGVNNYRNYFNVRLIEYYKKYVFPRVEGLVPSADIERALAAREWVNQKRLSDLEGLELFFETGGPSDTLQVPPLVNRPQPSSAVMTSNPLPEPSLTSLEPSNPEL